jgi:hypothetical protein
MRTNAVVVSQGMNRDAAEIDHRQWTSIHEMLSVSTAAMQVIE